MRHFSTYSFPSIHYPNEMFKVIFSQLIFFPFFLLFSLFLKWLVCAYSSLPIPWRLGVLSPEAYK